MLIRVYIVRVIVAIAVLVVTGVLAGNAVAQRQAVPIDEIRR
jgi:hypothetical protein